MTTWLIVPRGKAEETREAAKWLQRGLWDMKEPVLGTLEAKVSSSSWSMAQMNQLARIKEPYRIRVEPSFMSLSVDRVQRIMGKLTTAPSRWQLQLGSLRHRRTVILHL